MALALARAPEIAANVGRAVVMGGAPCCEGNVTPAAEYNIWVDPEAARMVARSGLPIELVGWHLCRGAAVLDAADIEHVLSIGTPLARFAVECNSTAMAAYRVQTGENRHLAARPGGHVDCARSIHLHLAPATTIWKSKPPAS